MKKIIGINNSFVKQFNICVYVNMMAVANIVYQNIIIVFVSSSDFQIVEQIYICVHVYLMLIIVKFPVMIVFVNKIQKNVKLKNIVVFAKITQKTVKLLNMIVFVNNIHTVVDTKEIMLVVADTIQKLADIAMKKLNQNIKERILVSVVQKVNNVKYKNIIVFV